MEERSNKTIMCSVFFLDIVEYSKKSVSGQISLKERFNKYLSHAIGDVPVADRVILDTGDGAAINFLGDVEDALRAALSLRQDLLSEGPDMVPPLLVRMGINLGPVRLVRDINGHPNIVGDGINVAQRVMGFADTAQILVSRSYYDAVSRLSPQYAGMFHYQGSRTDKHVREHEVYAIGYAGDNTTQKRRMHDASGTSVIVESNLDRSKVLANDIWLSSIRQLDTLINSGLAKFQKTPPVQRVLYVSAAVLFFVISLVMLISMSGNDREPTFTQSKPYQVKKNNKLPVQKKPPVKSVVVADDTQKQQPNSENGGELPAESKVSETQAAMVKVDKAVKAQVAKVVAKPKPKKVVQEKPQAMEKVIPPPAALPKPRVKPEVVTKPTADTAGGSEVSRISVSCIEGTEVFIDGVRKGGIELAPLVMAIPPGMHTVIVSHPSGGIYSKNIKLGAGKTVEIRPKFCK